MVVPSELGGFWHQNIGSIVRALFGQVRRGRQKFRVISILQCREFLV